MNADFKADFKSFVETDAKLSKAVNDWIALLHKKETELTRDQFIDLMFQAIASGDFIRQVRQGDNAQAMIYIPFAEQERLRTKIKEMEDNLESFRLVLSQSQIHLERAMELMDTPEHMEDDE